MFSMINKLIENSLEPMDGENEYHWMSDDQWQMQGHLMVFSI